MTTDKATKTAARTTPAASTKDKTPAAPRAKSFEVAPGHAFHTSAGRLEAGATVKAEQLKSKKDPTGEREFKRQQEKGALVLSTKRTADDFKDDMRAGGGSLDNGGGTGAAPSGAQVIAANTGDDPDATAVVDAALGGTAEELAKANGADGEAAKE